MQFKGIFAVLTILILLSSTAAFAKEVEGDGRTTTSKPRVSNSLTFPVSFGQSLSSVVPETLSSDHFTGLKKGSIAFKGQTYNFEEKLKVSQDSSLIVDHNILPYSRASFIYEYALTSPINLVSGVSESNPMTLVLLGKTFRVVDFEPNLITVRMADEIFFRVGESKIVDGRTVKLLSVYECKTSGPDCRFPGIYAKFLADDKEVITWANGGTHYPFSEERAASDAFSIRTSSILYKEGSSQNGAAFVAGKGATRTYRTGDAFIDQDQNDPYWIWDLENIKEGASTQSIRVKLIKSGELRFGGILNLPNNYVTISYVGGTRNQIDPTTYKNGLIKVHAPGRRVSHLSLPVESGFTSGTEFALTQSLRGELFTEQITVGYGGLNVKLNAVGQNSASFKLSYGPLKTSKNMIIEKGETKQFYDQMIILKKINHNAEIGGGTIILEVTSTFSNSDIPVREQVAQFGKEFILSQVMSGNVYRDSYTLGNNLEVTFVGTFSYENKIYAKIYIQDRTTGFSGTFVVSQGRTSVHSIGDEYQLKTYGLVSDAVSAQSIKVIVTEKKTQQSIRSTDPEVDRYLRSQEQTNKPVQGSSGIDFSSDPYFNVQEASLGSSVKLKLTGADERKSYVGKIKGTGIEYVFSGGGYDSVDHNMLSAKLTVYNNGLNPIKLSIDKGKSAVAHGYRFTVSNFVKSGNVYTISVTPTSARQAGR